MDILKQHELSSAFPAMSKADRQELKESIAKNGVLNPISIYQGKVIDGWHRYTIAQELGVDCPEVYLADDIDAVAFVIAQNKTRRHCNASQMALAVATVNQWRGAGNYSNAEPVHGSNNELVHVSNNELVHVSKTNKQLAEEAGVSDRYIQKAKELIKSGDEEKIKAVQDGELSLRTATKKEVEEEYTPFDAVNDALKDANIEIEQLKDSLATGGSLDFEQRLQELKDENARLTLENRALTISRDGLMAENTQLKRQIAMMNKSFK